MTVVSRRGALSGILGAVVAVQATPVAPEPTVEAVAPDWLADVPPWLLPKLERLAVAGARIRFDDAEEREKFWDLMGVVVETVDRNHA